MSAPRANALLLHTCHVVFIVPRFWIKRLLLEMPERAKIVCICMHAHTNCILFWQASYQSLLGGVIVNASNFHEQAGYTLASAFHLLKLTTTHPASRRLLHAFYQSALGTRLSCCVSANVWQLLALQLYFAKALSATLAKALPLHEHHVVFIVPRLLIKRLLLEMPERAKMFALHACSH